MRLALLWWKDWKWHKRQWPDLLIIYLLPLLVSAFYSYLNKGDYTAYHDKEAMVSHQTPMLNFPKGFIPQWDVMVFLPENTSKVEKKEFVTFCRRLCRGYKIRYYKKLKDIDRSVKHTATVIIDNFDVKIPALSYRYIDFRWRMQNQMMPDWGLWSRNQKGSHLPDGESTALMTQRLLDSHFYKRRECHLHNCTRTRPQKPLDLMTATVSHIAQPFFNPATASSYIVLGQFCTFASLLVVWQMADQAQDERHAGTNQLLLALGVSRFESLAAYWIVAYFKIVLVQSLIWLPPNFMLKNAYDLHVIIPGVLIYSGVLASFGCFCSFLFYTLFDNWFAARLCTFIHVVFLHLGQLAQEDRSGSQSKYFIMSSLVSFPNTWYYYLRAAATRRMIGGDFVPEGNVNSMCQLPTLFFAMILLFALALYYDTMFPEDGRRRPAKNWTFLFNPFYWRHKPAPAALEKTTFIVEEYLPDDPVFEEEQSSANQEPSESKKPKVVKTCAVEWNGVCKMIDEKWIVNRVSMKAYLDEVTVLYGPRGAGGKELLELSARRLQPDNGRISINSAGFVALSTTPCLLPQLTVKEMVRWQSRMRGGQTAEELALWLVELGLSEVEKKKVTELTDVQQQRLNLLLAFVGKSQVILLDEPTRNCPPGIRDVMLTFILQQKQKRAIIISTYSPEEADIADRVAFLSHGYLVSSGQMAAIRHKYINSMNLIIWPAPGLNTEKRLVIHKFLQGKVKTKILKVECETLPNENICFRVPDTEGLSMPKVMRGLELEWQNLCIKHVETQRQNIDDAYYTVIRKHESDQTTPINPYLLSGPLNKCYSSEPKRTKKLFWPELLTVFSLYTAFFRRHWQNNLLSFVMPTFLVVCLSGWILTYDFAHTVTLQTQMYSYSGARIRTNMVAMRNEKAVDYTDTFDKELLTGSRLYEEPAIVGGLLRDKRHFHVYTMKMARFSALLMQNLLVNTVLKSTKLVNTTTTVMMSLESMESPDWKQLSSLNEWPSLLEPLTSREMAEILIRQWKMIMILGAVVGIMLSRSTLLVAQLAKDKCMGMHCLFGCRAPLYWLALILFDIAIFLLVAIFSLLLLFAAAGTTGAGLVVNLLLISFAFISYLPVIYWLALKIKDQSTAYLAALLLAGSFSIIPACFPFFIRQYGSDLEDWTNLLTFVGYFSPPLAASLSAAIFDDLIRFGSRSAGEAFRTICPLILSILLHATTWIFLVVWLSTGHLQTRLQFWWKRMSTKPTDLYLTDISPGSVETSKTSKEQLQSQSQSTAQQLKKKGPSAESTMEHTRFESLAVLTEKTGGQNTGSQKKNSTKTAKTSKTEKTAKRTVAGVDDQETVVDGYWNYRDNVGSATPVVSFKLVELDHYAERPQMQADIFEQQSVVIYGDTSRNRSNMLDLAAGQSDPKTGIVTVNGKKASGKMRIGYVPTDNRLCSFLTVQETLKLAARLKDYVMPATQLIDYLLKMTELEQVAKKPVWQLTYADQRMLMFACAIIDRPAVLIMDEIDVYLSPMQIRTVWSITSMLRESYKMTLLFASSRVTEAEACSSHVVMISRGSVSLAETTCKAKSRHSTMFTLTLKLKNYMDRDAITTVILKSIPGSESYLHPHPRKLAFLVQFKAKKYVECVTIVRNLMGTLAVTDYKVEMPNLETVFEHLLTPNEPA